jgi:protein-S-isoprenylcysteine O-methyltransferase Ste14
MDNSRAFAAAMQLIRYSRLSLAVAAAVMTAASSAILVGYVRTDAILIVATGTLAAYWLDDLIDLVRDEARNPTLRSVRTTRVVFITIALAAIAAFAIWQLPRVSIQLRLLIAALAEGAIAFCLRHALALRRNPAPLHLPQAIGWAAACVLTPQLAASEPLDRYSWMAFGFFLLLMLPVTDMWRSAQAQSRTRLRWLVVCCALAAVFSIAGVVLRIFPWYNLALISAAVTNLLFLWIRQRSLIPYDAVFSELMVGFNTLCGLLVLGAWRSHMPVDQAGPASFADFFQLAAVAALLAVIAYNLWLRPGRESRTIQKGDPFPVVASLGLAVFAFQALLAALHLESWFLPWINTRLFHVTALQIAGAILMAAGVALLAAAYRTMGKSWRVGIDHDAPGALITSGIFLRTRNPIYVAGDLLVAGSFLLAPTITGLLYATITPLYFHLRIRIEESFLRNCYGTAYRNYAAKTRRYF